MAWRKSKGGLLVIICCLATSAHAEDRLSAGVGIGALYAGLGANIAMAGDRDFKFLAAGCVARINSRNACGAGIGWLRTDLFSGEPGKHALGLYAGPLTARWAAPGDLRTVYGPGITYSYFKNGTGNPGFQFGGMSGVSHQDGKTRVSVMLNLGYQF